MTWEWLALSMFCAVTCVSSTCFRILLSDVISASAGMVWSGLLFHGAVWLGMPFVLVWSVRATSPGPVLSCLIWSRLVWYRLAWSGLVV